MSRLPMRNALSRKAISRIGVGIAILVLLATTAYSDFAGENVAQIQDGIQDTLFNIIFAIPKAELISPGAKVCVEVDAGQFFSHNIVKTESGFDIDETASCDSSNQFIIKFSSLKMLEKFSNQGKKLKCPSLLRKEFKGTFLPSSLWVEGQNAPGCTAEFKNTYCNAVRQCLGNAKLPRALQCCN